MGFNLPTLCLIGSCLTTNLGCSSSGPNSANGTFSSSPYTTQSSDSGAYSISLWTAPEQPPSRGVNRVKLVVTDSTTDMPLSGLSIDLVPWMPAMGHGASVVPTVTEQGDGIYIAENVNFFMPASWQLRITISTHGDGSAGVTDSATPTFDIP